MKIRSRLRLVFLHIGLNGHIFRTLVDTSYSQGLRSRNPAHGDSDTLRLERLVLAFLRIIRCRSTLCFMISHEFLLYFPENQLSPTIYTFATSYPSFNNSINRPANPSSVTHATARSVFPRNFPRFSRVENLQNGMPACPA